MTIKTENTVFLDPRAIDQKEQEEKQKQLELEQQETAKEESIKIGGKFIMFFINPLIFMLLWNWTLPVLGPVMTINYIQSMSIYIMSRIIFRGNND
jgi:hypothetical protein